MKVEKLGINYIEFKQIIIYFESSVSYKPKIALLLIFAFPQFKKQYSLIKRHTINNTQYGLKYSSK